MKCLSSKGYPFHSPCWQLRCVNQWLETLMGQVVYIVEWWFERKAPAILFILVLVCIGMVNAGSRSRLQASAPKSKAVSRLKKSGKKIERPEKYRVCLFLKNYDLPVCRWNNVWYSLSGDKSTFLGWSWLWRHSNPVHTFLEEYPSEGLLVLWYRVGWPLGSTTCHVHPNDSHGMA